jgi:peptide/nickel transport system permease protein
MNQVRELEPVAAKSSMDNRRRRLKWVRVLLGNPRTMLGIIVMAITIFVAIFAPVLSPYPPAAQNLRNRLQPPSREHLLGTDNFGRDIFSRILHGARISLQVGFISVSIALVVGGLMGLLAGFYGGVLDNILMSIVDVLLALPAFLLALAIVASLGPNLTNVMIAVGIASVPTFARITRSAVLSVRELDYVAAAEAAGSSDLRIMFKYVIPNSVSPIIVQVTLSLASAILAAAGLSFLGLGAQPPTAEWGRMLNDARPFIRNAWWVVTFPGIAIVITVLALNLVGDGLRDALDPRSK